MVMGACDRAPDPRWPSTPPSRVALSLKMVRPFACDNAVEFTLTPGGDQTNVTWAMEGPSHFMSKVMSGFIDMDRLCGSQFEEGLANLKKVTETAPPASAVVSSAAHATR